MIKEVLDLEEKNGVYSLKATTSIYNLIKPGQDDFYNVDDMNGNMDIIEGELDKQSKQITDCKGEIEKVRGEIETAIGGIDLSSVNVHTTNVAETIVKPHIDVRNTETNTHISNTGASTVASVNNHTTNTGTSINANTNAKATEIKNHVTSQINASNGSTTRKTPTSAWKTVFTGSMGTACVNSTKYNTSYGVIDTLYMRSGDAIKLKMDSFVLSTNGSSGVGKMNLYIYLARAVDHTKLASGSTYNAGNSNYSNGDTMIQIHSVVSSDGNYVNDQTPVNLTFPAFDVNLQPVIDSNNVKVFGGEGLYHMVIQGYGTVANNTFIRPTNQTFNPKFYIGYDNKAF